MIPPPPPPPPPLPPSQPPEFLAEMSKEEADQEDERMQEDEPSSPQIGQEERVASYSDQHQSSGESPSGGGVYPTSACEDELSDKGATSLETETSDPSPPLEGIARRLRKGNLKSGATDALRKSRRVSFDPLALLLDASLEGELELVKKTALEVDIFRPGIPSMNKLDCVCV